jgi:CDP-glucose 4,6-dehydratase
VSVHGAFWARRRVLVTGHSGFKGAWLTLWLQALGADTHGLSAGSPSTPSLHELARIGTYTVEHDVDVRDFPSLQAVVAQVRPEVVFHLAAQPLVRRSYEDPRGTYEVNVMGTVNVLEAVREIGSTRAVVIVTSDKCYENRGTAHPFSEEDPMGGSDPYSSSKGCAELVTAAYRRSFFSAPAGARVASARAGNVIGGGDWGADRLLPDLVRAAERGTPARVRNPAAVRPWQHVLAPVSGYLQLAQALAEGAEVAEGWNFGPDPQDAQPVRWIAERLAARWPGGLRWESDEGPHPPEAGVLTIDSRKAAQRLGWRPRWRVEEALERIVEWHAAHLRGEDMRAVSLAQIEAYEQ